MPIISNLDNTGASMNGGTGNSLLFNSLDDEESFVVLERSTANDVGLGLCLAAEAPTQTQSQSQQNNCSYSVFNNSSGGMSSSRISHQSQVDVDPLPIPFDNSNIAVSAEEIEKRLQEVLHENINLKENLYQTNLAMKQQLSTVRLLQDRALDTQKNHQAKFEETKSLILKLGLEKNELQEKLNQLSEELKKMKEENKELKNTNIAFGAEATKLVSENASLKTQLTIVQENLQVVAEKEKKVSLQPTAKEVELHELVDQLTRKLEAVERARRQQDFDIDKLQAQLARTTADLNETQRKLAHSENAIQVAPVKNDNSLPYGEKLTKYEGLLKQFKTSIEEEQTRFNSLNSWLSMTDPTGNSAQFEISELRRLLAEEQTQSVARKEKLYQAVATIHELLVDFQKLGEDLERVKADHAVKESHGLAYDEMQKKGFRERLDSLTAKLVEREEALAISERHLASLQEAVRLQNDDKKDAGEVDTLKEQVNNLVGEVTTKDEALQSKIAEINVLKTEVLNLRGNCDTIAVLEEQAKIYQADFEAERKSRESLVAEKDRLLEDLRHLQRRNQELIEELHNVRADSAQTNRPQTSPPSGPRPQERAPSPPPPRSSENVELQINMIFHEKQDGNLCAQHCLNALLQGAYFNAVDLAELAREMDYAEKTTLAEAGVDSREYQSFINRPSQNMDDTGFFSVQVISCALALWGLELVPFGSTEPRAVEAQRNLTEVKAFICHSHAHWFTIRRIGHRWFNLNSVLYKPQPLSDFYLSLFLEEFEREGNLVFMVFGDLPPSAADGEVTRVPQNNGEVVPSNIVREPNSIRPTDINEMNFYPGELRQKTLHLVLSQRSTPLPWFSDRIKQFLRNH